MIPIAEPASDIRAQIAALLDPAHPKIAVYAVPANEKDIPDGLPPYVLSIKREEGTLLTTDPRRAALFGRRADDAAMAWLLGYPEDKGRVVARCGGDPNLAIAVQARTREGAVVTEAFTSRPGLDATIDAIGRHVPAGGSLELLRPQDAVGRRLVLRVTEKA